MEKRSNEEILEEILENIGLKERAGKITMIGKDPILKSAHRIGDASLIALSVLGAEVANIFKKRTNQKEDIEINIEDAIYQLMAAFLTKVNNVEIKKLTEDMNLFGNCDFYETADNRYVYVVTTYAHLRDATCRILKCQPFKESYREAIKNWNSFELEEQMNKRGGACFVVRSKEEWLNHPQGKLLNESNLIKIEKLKDGDRKIFSKIKETELPLKDIKVIDNTHVVAGPISTRILAELGAEVLHTSTPDHPDSIGMVVETNIGKRSAYCDIKVEKQLNQLKELFKETDVFVNNYLSVKEKGLSIEEIIEVNPEIIILDLNGWGDEGEWTNRKSFDQLACAGTGFAVDEGSFEKPSLPPTYLLNDYLTSMFGAAGVIEALKRRDEVGGSYRVHVNLARICMWVQELGIFEKDELEKIEEFKFENVEEKLTTVSGAFGKTMYLPTKIIYSTIKPYLSKGAEPLGASELKFDKN